MPSLFRRFAAVLTALVLTGCAALPGGLEPPRVTISAMEMRDATLFEQVYAIQLRLQNPNNRDLAIQGLSFELEINDASFASGGSAEAVVIPRLGSGIVRVEAVSGPGSILQQLMKLQRSPPKPVSYRISGAAYVGPGGWRLPFEDRGEFALPASAAR
ncbi:MAG: LEA type 2 family protein [Pseudomonadota bacterium]